MMTSTRNSLGIDTVSHTLSRLKYTHSHQLRSPIRVLNASAILAGPRKRVQLQAGGEGACPVVHMAVNTELHGMAGHIKYNDIYIGLET